MRPNINVTFICKSHMVWWLKQRRDVLVKDADVQLKQIIHNVIRERDAEVIEVEVMPIMFNCWWTSIRGSAFTG